MSRPRLWCQLCGMGFRLALTADYHRRQAPVLCRPKRRRDATATAMATAVAARQRPQALASVIGE